MISKTKQPSYYGCIMIKSLTAKINADVSLTSTFCVIKTGKMIFNYILVLGINKTNAKTIAIVLALIKKNNIYPFICSSSLPLVSCKNLNTNMTETNAQNA